MTVVEISLKARPYQQELINWFRNGGKRACAVWHRRAGKDLVCLNWTVVASQMRVGTYWHLFPTAKQGRKIVWDGMTNDGRAYLDFWPEDQGREADQHRDEAEASKRVHVAGGWGGQLR